MIYASNLCWNSPETNTANIQYLCMSRVCSGNRPLTLTVHVSRHSAVKPPQIQREWAQAVLHNAVISRNNLTQAYVNHSKTPTTVKPRNMWEAGLPPNDQNRLEECLGPHRSLKKITWAWEWCCVAPDLLSVLKWKALLSFNHAWLFRIMRHLLWMLNSGSHQQTRRTAAE